MRNTTVVDLITTNDGGLVILGKSTKHWYSEFEIEAVRMVGPCNGGVPNLD